MSHSCLSGFDFFQVRLQFVVMTILICVSTSSSKIYKFSLKRSTKLLNEAVLELGPSRGQERHNSFLKGSPGRGYYLEIAIGTPPQMIDALVDTGSSNFAVAAKFHPDVEKIFNISGSSSLKTDFSYVSVPYTQGKWDGYLGTDVLQIQSMPNVSIIANIALITDSNNFFINGSHWEGILGLAYKEITRPNGEVEPVFDSFVRQANVNNIFSMQLCSIGSNNSKMNDPAGNLVFGGIDSSLYFGDIWYATVYKEWYYEVVITNIAVDDNSLAMDCKEYNFDKSIVDSGTTNLRLPMRVFERLVNMMIVTIEEYKERGRGVIDYIPFSFWQGGYVFCFKPEDVPWSNFPTLRISLAVSGNASIDLVIQPQLYLRPLQDGEPDYVAGMSCYRFSISPAESGTVIGAVIMEGFFVVFDREQKRIGFARTNCDRVEGHLPVSYVEPSKSSSVNNFDCAYIKPINRQRIVTITMYVMGTFCVVMVLVITVFVARYQISHCRFCRNKNDIDLLANEER